MTLLDVTLRILVAFFVLIILTRIMGRKEIGQLTFFNFVSAIAVGTIGASIVVDSSLSIRNGVYILAGWTLLTLIFGYIDIKSRKARILLDGNPIIVIKDGKVMDNEMRKARLDLDLLKAMLRKKNAFSIAEVDYAILETDGKLSVLKKEEEQPLTKKNNLNSISTKIFPATTQLISDGSIIKSNVEKLNLSEEWVHHQLHQAGLNSLSEVFYAEIQKDGTLYVDQVNDS